MTTMNAEQTAAVRERPILFSSEMVRAILDGRKTQTRRVVKGSEHVSELIPAETENGVPLFDTWMNAGALESANGPSMYRCPFGVAGECLWVRETWEMLWPDGPRDASNVRYLAGSARLVGETFKPSIHMPRWASRITLEITSVKVERLQDISPGDALAEGITVRGCAFPRGGHIAIDTFSYLWESINGPGSWDANPWVWAISFRRLP